MSPAETTLEQTAQPHAQTPGASTSGVTPALGPEPAGAAPARSPDRVLGRLRHALAHAPAEGVGTRGLARVARALAGPALVGTAWQVAPRTGVVDPVFLPPLSDVLARWWQLALAGDLWAHTQASLVRAGTGFVLALAAALPLGLLIGWFRPIAELLNPVLNVFWNTAVLALLPVFVLFFGIGEESKIAIVGYACLWPILLNTINAVRTVDPLLVKSARSLGLGPLRLFQKVILPGTVPTVFTGIRLSAAASILVLVAAEMVGAREGLGFLIINSQANFAIPDMYSAILTVSAIGLIINQLLLALERRFSRWRPSR